MSLGPKNNSSVIFAARWVGAARILLAYLQCPRVFCLAMGKLSEWFKTLLAKLNIHGDNSLTQKESEYVGSGIEKENYLLVELGAYVHAIFESLDKDTMGKVFDDLGNKIAREFSNRPHLREVYLLADDAR